MAVMEAFFKIPRGGLEIGGVLFGRYREGRLRIEEYRELPCDYAAGPSFTLEEPDQARLRELLAAGAAEGLTPVGWFRSRTRSGIALSEADLRLHHKYFPEPWQVCLVLRPEVTRPTRAGFFFRDSNGVMRMESSYREFELKPGVQKADAGSWTSDVGGASGGYRDQQIPAVQDHPTSDSQHPTSASVPIPAFLSEAPPSRRPWRALWICAIVAGLVAGGWGARQYMGDTEDHLSLEAQDRSGQLHLSWDRSSRPVRQATGATLEITDGETRVSTVLQAAQLRRGSFYYTRRTERVDVHMTVIEPDGRATDEYVSFLGRLP
jgi:hypothetical protein